MSQELFYIAPSKEIFFEMKKQSIKLWETYDNDFGYVSEKIDNIIDLENIGSNFIYIFNMFDIHNQNIIKRRVSKECLEEINKRLYQEKLGEDGSPLLGNHL